jgi:hypothetical protein
MGIQQLAFSVAMVAAAAAARADWALQQTQDPFDDDQVMVAALKAPDLELRVECKGAGRKQTFRTYFYTGHLMDADQRAFGSNAVANAFLGPQISAKLRFGSTKPRNLSFFATDDWRGFWTGEREAAKVARSLIGSQKLTVLIYGLAGENKVIEMVLPAETGPLHQVMQACGQKIDGKSYL